MTVLDWARRYVRNGLSVFPLRLDGSKAPAVAAWNPYRERVPTDAELEEWFADGARGVAVVGGPISGGLVVLDFESEPAYAEWLAHIGPLAEDVAGCPLVVTPSGGRHLYLRCPTPPRNLKLALDESGEVSIETRGDGGYVAAPGSPAAVHELKVPYTLERAGWLA